MVEKIIKGTYKIIAYIAILFVTIYVTINNIFRSNYSGFSQIIFIIFEFIMIFIFNKYILNKIIEKKQKILLAIFIMIMIFLALEIISVIYFRVEYNWDFKWVMDTAKDIATTGTSQNMYYFKMFPNNIAVLAIITCAMKLFAGSEIGAYIINIIFIFVSVVMTIICAKKMEGYKLAVNTSLLLLCCAPLYLYAPIIYSDTLSLPFPILTLYFYIKMKENKEDTKKYYLDIVLMTIMGVVGFCIKPVAAIVLVAIVIENLMSINKKNLKNTLLIFMVFIILMMCFNFAKQKLIIKDIKKNDMVLPYTHWLMMGLNLPKSEGGTSIGYGAYSEDDANNTNLQNTYQKKVEYNKKIIKERLKNFGLWRIYKVSRS